MQRMVGELSDSRSWLLWTGMFLVVMVVAVMLGSGLEASQAANTPVGVEVNKTVNMPSVMPGQAPAPLYTVTFTNPKTTDVILDRITDTLPSGFDFIGMAPGSDWEDEPADSVEPVIVWTGPITIPASGKLTLVYAVFVPQTVPPSIAPYVNTVSAVAHDGTAVEQASARLVVGAAHLGVDKQASPARVLSGGQVVYTVVFSNSGQLTGTVELITDTLDPSLTFVAMVAGSDVMTEPHQVLGALIWDDPLQVPPQQALTLKYKVQTSTAPGWSWPSNRVEADVGKGILTAGTIVEVGPEKSRTFLPAVFKNFEIARLTVTKTASPTKVSAVPGAVVTYTVIIKNEGDTTGDLKTVNDTLPTGFTFSAMATGSDITSSPSGTTGKITWSGSWSMAPGSQKRVIYRVLTSQTEGQYTNSVNVTAQQALVPLEPAAATVTVEKGTLLQDNFNDGISRWTPFLNYPQRLREGQWYWGETDGVDNSGALTHDCCNIAPKVAHDALMMYLGEGAEQWTNYRVEAQFLLGGGVDDEGNYDAGGGYPIGLWVRGQYEPSDTPGQWVTGYYVVVGGKLGGAHHFVRLGQLQTATDCWEAACDHPTNLYTFNNVHTLQEVAGLEGEFTRYEWHTLVVEVQGATITVWLDGEWVMEYVDDKEPFLMGTVGFKTYKSSTASFDNILVTPLSP